MVKEKVCSDIMNFTFHDVEDIYCGKGEDESNLLFVNSQITTPNDVEERLNIKLDEEQYVCTYVDVCTNKRLISMCCMVEGEVEKEQEYKYPLTDEEKEHIYDIVAEYCVEEEGRTLEDFLRECYESSFD